MKARISILLVLLFVISVSSNNAYADDIVLEDQTSCENISGSWDEPTSTCSVSSFMINNLDTLTIASGVTLSVDTLLQNLGTFTNNGIFILTDTGEFGNNGYFENLGDFQNLGTTYVIGILDNQNTSTINNAGRIELTGTGDLNNDGTMNSPGSLDVGGSSTLDNFDLIDFGTGASISINPSGTLNNEGTILFCDWIIEGTISGPGTLTDTCPSLNSPPVFPSFGTLEANEELLFEFDAQASDPDFLQSLTYSLIGEPAGMTINSVTGLISWFPDDTQGGASYTFDIIATDDGSPPLSSTATVIIIINDVNLPPTLDPIFAPSLVDEGDTISFTATASDSDMPAQILTFSLTGAPDGATIDSVTGAFSWTPGEPQQGTHTFEVLVTDNGSPPLSDSETITITVNEVNQSPFLAPIDPQTASEGIEFLLSASATDSDIPAQTLVYSLANAPFTATIFSNGTFAWIPGELDGGNTYTGIEIHVTDGVSEVFTTFDITVLEANSAPSLNAIPAQTVSEGALISSDAEATDPDVPSQSLTYGLSGAPAGMTINPSTGLIEWTPSESQGPGIYVVDVIATDDQIPPLSDSELMTITVTEINTPPSIAAIDPQTTDEHIQLTVNASATDIDEPANNLTFSLGSGAPVGASIDPDTGVFTWTPGESNGGNNYSIEVQVTDEFDSASTTFSIDVIETNSPPSIDPIPTQFADEEELFEYQIIATDPDIPFQSLTYGLSDAPAGMTIDSSTGLISWTPSESDDGGSFTFTVTVTDDQLPPLSDTESMTVTLTNVNSPPVLAPLNTPLSVSEGDTITFTATATDSDLPEQFLTFSLVNPQSGMTIDPSTGVFQWIPSELQGDGAAIFDVKVEDSGLPPLSDSQTVTILVYEVNSPPSVDPIPLQKASETNPFAYQVVAADPDVPGFGVLTYGLSDAPAGMTIDSSTGLISWTPTTSQIGTFTFSVVVTDGVNSTPTPTTITVYKVFCDRPEYEFVVITGTSGNNKLVGTNGDDLIRGLDGDDKIQGKDGNDCLIGGNGVDKIWGGEGDDTLQGDAGSDRLYAQDGNDLILGGDGNDKVWGGKGQDNIDGGKGDDRIHANQDNDTVTGGDGNDWLGGGIGNDIIKGGLGDDKLFGKQGNDDLFGEAGNDFMLGGQGNDDMFGGDGTDKCHDKQGTNTFNSCESKPSMPDEDDECEEDDERDWDH